MNRQQRRAARAVSDAAAIEMAANSFDYTPDGRLVKVTHPKAVAALRRAYSVMMDNKCAPLATRISPEAAAKFPRAKRPLEGVKSYLAVGLDPEGRGAYSLRDIATPDAPPELEDTLNRRAALAKLQPKLQRVGFPMTWDKSGGMQ
jgi:hypothetical protein